MVRIDLSLVVSLLGLVAPAAAQSPHELRRTWQLELADGTSGRLVAAPQVPSALRKKGELVKLDLLLTIGATRWAGTGVSVGDDRLAGQVLTALAPVGPGATSAVGGILQGEVVEPSKLPESIRVDLQEKGLAARGRVHDLRFTARRAPIPTDGDVWTRAAALDKQAALWIVAQEHPYAASTLPALGTKEALNANFKQTTERLKADGFQLVSAFRATTDLLPARWKLRHPFGAVACATFEPAPGHPYTGVLAATVPALVRLTINVDAPDAWNPGIGLKLLVSGGESVNVLASTFFDPTAPGVDRGLFAHALENRNKLGRLSLDHVAAVNPDGSAVANPVAPHLLRFIPEPGLPREGAADFRTMLSGLGRGTVIHRVVDQDGKAVGLLRTTTSFVASDSGDRLLHFAHHARPIRGQGTGQGLEDPRYGMDEPGAD